MLFGAFHTGADRRFCCHEGRLQIAVIMNVILSASLVSSTWVVGIGNFVSQGRYSVGTCRMTPAARPAQACCKMKADHVLQSDRRGYRESFVFRRARIITEAMPHGV